MVNRVKQYSDMFQQAAGRSTAGGCVTCILYSELFAPLLEILNI